MKIASQRRSSNDAEPRAALRRLPMISESSIPAAYDSKCRLARGSATPLFPEFLRELPGNPLGEHVGEHQHVSVPVIVGLYVRYPILLESADDFAGREVEMRLQHVLKLLLGPMRVGAAQESRNVLAICGPFF